jgi:wyosine [tRNA(Phe)-imidazoG37] synthetase (radical SAM superfamily)
VDWAIARSTGGLLVSGRLPFVKERSMSRFVRIEVDLDAMTDEAFAFVTDPTPSRNDRPIVQELSDLNPDVVDVLECMVLDGTEARADVEAYLAAVFGAVRA